jgi:hypothetical protein
VKKLTSFICLTLLVALAATAFGFATGGEFVTDKFGGTNANRYSPAFAPGTATTVTLGTKGVTNVSLGRVQAYTAYFTNASTGALVTTGLMKLGGFTLWGETGSTPMVNGTVFNVGKNVTRVGFAPYSSATALKVHILTQ